MRHTVVQGVKRLLGVSAFLTAVVHLPAHSVEVQLALICDPRRRGLAWLPWSSLDNHSS